MYKLYRSKSYIVKPLFKWNISRKYNAQKCAERVCVIGSGPAGFSVTQYLLKNHDTLHVDMVEKYPVPYGLVRFGVSPDHQDVKNCIHGYERVAENPRFSFYGGVNVGETVPLKKIIENYTAVVLCTGAQGQQELQIPEENLQNVFSSNEFVGWYNGVPEYSNVDPDLSGTTAAIIGVGNVALDCARMLLKPHKELKETDITQYSYEKLVKSNIKRVFIIGRRGPLQMACTRKELSEITDMDGLKTIIEPDCFTKEVENALKIKDLKLRKTQRLIKHLMKASKKSNTLAHDHIKREFIVKLLSTPVELIGLDNHVKGLILKRNEMSGPDAFSPVIVPTEETGQIDCSIVISCIGYKNLPIDPSVPFDKGQILNDKGRVVGDLPLYTCGWCKTGPKGVLADTINDCLITAGTILDDLPSLKERKPENQSLLQLIKDRDESYLSWNDWKTLDRHEEEIGKSVGKVREKVTSLQEMIELALSNNKTGT